MIRTAAAILAGGKGERLGGVNKALLTVGGNRLIDRALEAVAGCEPVVIAAGPLPVGGVSATIVPDLDSDYAGPLAGVAAAVAVLAGNPPDLLLTLAVDTPFFPADFVDLALPLLGSAPGVLAAYAGQAYPTNGLWRFEAIAGLPAALRDRTAPRSLKRLAEDLGATTLDYSALASADPFANVNTPADLAALEARARAADGA